MQTISVGKIVSAPVEPIPAQPLNPATSFPVPGIDTAFETGPDFVVEIATGRVDDPTFQATWSALVAASDSPQKIYQTPEFFQFLRETPKEGIRLEVLALVRLRDGAVVGVVPVRVCQQHLNFKLGPLSLCSAKVDMVNLLGSIPATPTGMDVSEFLLSQLLALFPQSRAVFMQALPADSGHWNNLQEMAGQRQLTTALMGDWRDCHTMPLPATFDQYLGKFSSKKRYNLNRQIRMLGEQAGELVLTRIERPEQVPAMMAGLKGFLSAYELHAVPSEAMLTSLAGRKLLLCYVLRAGEDIMAAVIGTRSPDTLHIHNIFVEKKHLALSVGTSAMHLAIEDMVGLGCLRSIDFGYGTPNNEFRSSHVLQTRAQVMVYDRMRATSLLFFAHGVFSRTTETVISLIKSLRTKVLAVRKLIAA